MEREKLPLSSWSRKRQNGEPREPRKSSGRFSITLELTTCKSTAKQNTENGCPLFLAHQRIAGRPRRTRVKMNAQPRRALACAAVPLEQPLRPVKKKRGLQAKAKHKPGFRGGRQRFLRGAIQPRTFDGVPIPATRLIFIR